LPLGRWLVEPPAPWNRTERTFTLFQGLERAPAVLCGHPPESCDGSGIDGVQRIGESPTSATSQRDRLRVDVRRQDVDETTQLELSRESVDALSRGIELSGDHARVHVRALIQQQHDLHLGVREPEAFDGGI
jgi:hypothetical protein